MHRAAHDAEAGVQYDTDILVVGGGVNGAGIARDAAGRGLSVTLCEQDDLASHTSSASTKLIHGGLRYLEQYEFRLVAKALAEREVILRLAPHITWPMLFVLPHETHLRPVWMIRLGPDAVRPSGCFAPHPGGLQGRRTSQARQRQAAATGVSARFRVFGRLGAGCAPGGAERDGCGAPRCEGPRPHALREGRCPRWRMGGGRCRSAMEGSARACTDAGQRLRPVGGALHRRGRWASADHPTRAPGQGQPYRVPRLFDHEYAYIFQQPDQRIVFAIPYEDRLHAGRHHGRGRTTGIPAAVEISEDETRYLCDAVNRYFSTR